MGCTTSNNNDNNNVNKVNIDSKEIKYFIPNIGFVAKTKKPNSFAINKVFINIFHNNTISYVIYNESKIGYDKSGETCIIYDSIVSTSIFNKLTQLTIEEYENAKLYIAQQIIDYINIKSHESLDINECKIPKIKRGYVGEEIPPFLEEHKLKENKDNHGKEIQLFRKTVDILANAAIESNDTIINNTINTNELNNILTTTTTTTTATTAILTTATTVTAATINIPSIPLPMLPNTDINQSPPSMKGNLWRLYINNNNNSAIWKKEFCMLLDGKMNEKDCQINLEEYGLLQFKFIEKIERTNIELIDTEFNSILSSTMLLTIISDYVNKELNINNNNIKIVNAKTTIKLKEILLDSKLNSISSCSSILVLYSRSNNVTEHYICYLCETDKDSLSWVNALNSHLRHYFPNSTAGLLIPKDEDDDNEIIENNDIIIPPLIKGDGKKQGRHIIKTWKQRYFVLENGILNYYESAVPIYPYGVDKRGDIELSTFIVQMSHNIRKNIAHQSDTADSPEQSSAITFISEKLKEKFVIVFDHIVDENGHINPNAWYDNLLAHIKYAKLIKNEI